MNGKLTKAQLEAEAHRLATSIRNAKRRLPIGARVKMSNEALLMFPRFRGIVGTIVGHKFGTTPMVRWDGYKTASSYAPWLILRLGRASLKQGEPM
jgi:hypothetical protein